MHKHKLKIVSALLVFFTTNVFALEWSTYITPGLVQAQIHNNSTYIFPTGNGIKLAVPGCPQAYIALIRDQPGSKNVISTLQIAKAMGEQVRFGGTCHTTNPDIYFMVEYIQAK